MATNTTQPTTAQQFAEAQQAIQQAQACLANATAQLRQTSSNPNLTAQLVQDVLTDAQRACSKAAAYLAAEKLTPAAHAVLTACIAHFYADQGDLDAPTLQGVQLHIATCMEMQGYDMQAICDWLATRSPAQLQTLCTGDQEEFAPLLASAPYGTHELLDELFMQIGG